MRPNKRSVPWLYFTFTVTREAFCRLLCCLLFVVVADQAAVGEVGGAGDVSSVFGGEEQSDRGDIINGAQTPQGNVGEQRVKLGLVIEQAGVHGSDDCAGGDVVDRDAQRAKLDGEVAHQHADATLGGAIAGEVGEDHVFVDRAEVDDAARLLGVAQAANEGLAKEEGTLEVNVEDGVVVLLGDVPEVRADLDAGVVDENVAAAELLVGLLDQVMGVGGFGDIALNSNSFSTCGLDFGLGLIRALELKVVDDDRCAFAGETNADGLPNA